jgi:hypothetical protein
MILTLSIVHQIFLTRDEKYLLINGSPIEVIGVSLPVWSSDTFTTDPAEEVFCKYKLLNNGEPYSVNNTVDGYLITLSSKTNYKSPVYPSNEVWRNVPIENREAWYDKNQPPSTVKNLLDIKDGGASYLRFKYHKKIQYKEHFVNMFNYVEIKDMKTLNDSMCI